MRDFHYGFDPGFWGWFFPLLILVTVAGLAFLVVWAWRPRRPALTDADPLRRAAARYATGEIERVEFERIQRDLGAAVESPVAAAAMRFAKGEITEAEFDELRAKLETADATE